MAPMLSMECSHITLSSVVSDSVWPHRRQPTRLPRHWDSPGKNTGVGCHFFLQCMKVKSESEVAQASLTLSDSMNCSPPGSSVHGGFQARVLEWGAIAFSNGVFYFLSKKLSDRNKPKYIRSLNKYKLDGTTSEIYPLHCTFLLF